MALTVPDFRVAALFITRDCCPVCGSDGIRSLFSAPYDDSRIRGFLTSHYRNQGKVDFSLLREVEYTIDECKRCRLIYQRMAPTDEMLGIIYNEFIDPQRLKAEEMAMLTLDNSREVLRRLSDVFRRLNKPVAEVKFLDYGCGYSRWGRMAVGLGATVYGTEIGDEKITYAETLGITMLTDSELAGYQFDVVHTEQVFEHLREPGAVFDLLAGCVAPGGVFKISVPKQGRIRGLLRRGFIDYSPFERPSWAKQDYLTIAPLEHLNAFGRESIGWLAARAGFSMTMGSFGGRNPIWT
jgi:SAM-dependent methyltransferase